MSKPSNSARDNRANQFNQTHPIYLRSWGADLDHAERIAAVSKSAPDRWANQLNPNNFIHWASRRKSRGQSTSNPSSAIPQRPYRHRSLGAGLRGSRVSFEDHHEQPNPDNRFVRARGNRPHVGAFVPGGGRRSVRPTCKWRGAG